ncbi:DUF1552 domain-containing protein [Paracidovorax citrulli]
MSISVSRRRLLLGLAAAGGLGALGAGAYYLNRTSLARWAVDGRELKGALQGGKPKVVFVILADGLGTLNLNNATPDQAAPSDPNDRQIWHPWDGEVGNNSYRSLGLDVEGPLLAMLSSELEPYRSRSLYIRGTSLATNYEAHSGWTSCLRDNNKAHASIDHIIGQKLSNYAATQKAVFCGHITHNPTFRVSYSGAGTAIRDMQSNPHRLFASLFPDQAGRSRSGGKHVFDPALADLRELKEGMSPRERQKLESHLDAIEQVQNDLDSGPVEPGPGCDPHAAGVRAVVARRPQAQGGCVGCHVERTGDRTGLRCDPGGHLPGRRQFGEPGDLFRSLRRRQWADVHRQCARGCPP